MRIVLFACFAILSRKRWKEHLSGHRKPIIRSNGHWIVVTKPVWICESWLLYFGDQISNLGAWRRQYHMASRLPRRYSIIPDNSSAHGRGMLSLGWLIRWSRWRRGCSWWF